MNQQEQTNAFARDLEALIHRYRAEFSLTLASVVGVLTVQSHQLITEQAGS